MKVAGAITIAGTALWLPEKVYSAAEAQEAAVVTKADSEGEGISALPIADLFPPGMACLAATEALTKARVVAKDLALLVHAWVYHQGPQTWTPPHRVARELGASDCVALGVRQMSNGGAMAVQMAVTHLLTERRAESALVTTADSFAGLPYDRWLSAPPLGDGATAVVFTRGPGPQVIESIASVGDPELELAYPTSDPFEAGTDRTRTPPTRTALRGFSRGVRRAAEEALEDAGLRPSDISSVLLPRLGRTLVTHLAGRALPDDLAAKVVLTGRNTGHLGAGDLPANLAEHPAPADGEHHLHVSVGAGFTATCLITRGTRS